MTAVALGLAAVPHAPPAATAQQQSWNGSTLGAQAIEDLIAQGMTALRADDLDTAQTLFETANDATYGSAVYPLPIKHLPNLALARVNFRRENHAEVNRFASSVASILDTPEYRNHPYRIEALAFQGAAAYFLDHDNEADLLLRAAYDATEGREDLAEIRDLAHFYLALTAQYLGSPDAPALRESYLQGVDGETTWVRTPELAHLYFLHASALRDAGTDAQDLVDYFAAFMDAFDDNPAIDAQWQSFYRGYFAMLLGEAGDWERAIGLLESRHAYLTENRMFDDEYLWNAQRLAVARSVVNGYEDGGAFLVDTIAFAVAQGLGDRAPLAILHKTLAHVRGELGDMAGQQAHLRETYAILRRTLGPTNGDVVLLAAEIDRTDPGFAGFAYADEIHGTGQGIDLAPDGAAVLAAFLAGDYLGVQLALAEHETDHGTPPLFLLNRALYFALIGFEDRALTDLAALRGAVRDMAEPALAPDAPMLDIIEALARAWSSDRNAAAAVPMLERLLARADLAPAVRRIAVALAANAAFRVDDRAGIAAAGALWAGLPRPEAPGPWDVFADAIFLDAHAMLEDPVTLRTRLGALRTAASDIGNPALLADYIALIGDMNDPDAMSRDSDVSELGRLIGRLSVDLPPHHMLIASAQFLMASALRYRGETADALVWMDRTAVTMRKHPAHNPDALAFALSQQADLLFMMDQPERAALIAREAYALVDFATARGDLAASVLSTYARTLRERTGDDAGVAAVLSAHIDDPAYFDRVPPSWQMDQLTFLADLSLDTAPWNDVRAILDRAEAALPDDDGRDWRMSRSRVIWSRASGAWRAGDVAAAYGDMRRSNALRFAEIDDIAAEGRLSGITAEELKARATWEAMVGWEYAQGLTDDG
ncbi:hypothetical protein [Oceaniglobus indicus]|uniref:hypothetical protein n=1 Tax=Oceaniglobus indicus TaxID=2047749 RepID=UPI0011AB7CE8|nr:hypothetical protein [Oceaniglobus indicus]